MDVEVKQRNRRRKRAQRMQAQRDSNKAEHAEGDSGDEDVVPAKPPRPPNRRKKSKEPLCEEEIIDGFAILQFRSYEDLELVLKISTKENIKRLTEIERPKIEPKAHITNHILVQHNHGLTLSHDPATSDDSGRASERLTGSSVAPRDADSSRDRLSDASSRCSSGKGYICDSEGEDDKGSDVSSVIFASTPASRKHEFPGALPPGLPSLAGHGTSGSPVPAPTPPNVPVPSPAPAQQPPQHPPQAIASATAAVAPSPIAAAMPTAATTVTASIKPLPVETPAAPMPAGAPQQPPPVSVPSVPTAAAAAASTPQPVAAAAPLAHHHHLLHPPTAMDTSAAASMVPGGGGRATRTDSPAVATSANAAVAPSPGQYHHQSYSQHQHHHHHQPLYAPYATATAVVSPVHTATAASPYAQQPTAVATALPPPPADASVAAPVTQLQPPPQQQQQQQQQQPPQQPVAAVAPMVINKVPPMHVAAPEREKQMVPPTVRGPSPVREVRESYSNISTLSKSSASTTVSAHQQAAVTTTATVPPSSLAATVRGGSITHGKPWSSPPVMAQPATQPPSVTAASSAAAAAAAQHSPALPPRPTPPLHSAYPATAQPPLFAAPSLPPPVSRASPITGAPPSAVPPPNPNPFSAESLFQSSKYQTNQADMLRRELDNRFLASQDRSLGVGPPPYLRTEMHQHQHHHTHVHQHTTSLLPPPAASSLYPSPLSMSPMERLARRSQSGFKDIPKLGSVDSPFYRQNLGLSGTYPGYTPGLMHPGLTTGPTPFAPPNHLPTFQPKSVTPQDPTKPKIVKTGKWNAMHVRVAWEIYHHQQKSGEAKGSIATAKPPTDLLRPPTHLFSPSVHSQRPPHELQFAPSLAASHRPPAAYEQPHHASSLFTAPGSHLGKSPFSTGSTLSPFTRYGGAPLGASSTSPFSMSPFARDPHLNHLGPLHHDPWRTLQRTMPAFPPSVNPLPPTLPGLGPPPGPPWAIKPDPILEQREREAREREERERERLRREREERERREREEKQRRLEQQQQEQRERERREREKREMERRELERQRERERERLLQEQRMAESAKQIQSPIIRDRSPLRNGDMSDIRVKEEPRIKEEDIMARADPRYHNPFLRHPGPLGPPPGPMLDRSRLLPHALQHHPYHTAAPTGHWGAPPTDPFYRYGYNPLMDAMRVQEERANFFNAYGAPHHPSQLRPKDPALMHLRTGPGPGPPPAHKMSATPPTDLHKKEEPR